MSMPSGGVEPRDNGLRHKSELAQGDQNRLAGHKSFIDRYKRGDLHFGVRKTFKGGRNYGFIASVNPSGSNCADTGADAAECCWLDFDVEHPPMFSHDVGLMKGPQKRIASIIRFQVFEDRFFSGGEPLYAFEAAKGVHKALRGSVNGKVGFRHLRYAVAIAYEQSRGEQVQAASDDVDERANFNVEAARQRDFWERYYQVVRGWGWRLSNFNVDVFADPVVDLILEGWEFAYGPVNASLGVEKVVPHG